MSASLQDLLRECTDSEVKFKKISSSLVAYIKDTTKNIKLQKPIVDHIKVVIKSKKHTSFQKVLALRLLHKCIEVKCSEFNKYVDKKVLKRLLIFAEHNKDRTSSHDLLTKGENIFTNEEKDRKNAAAFLILLLHYIERWASIVPLSDDLKSASPFAKGFHNLQSKKVLFPSQVKDTNIRQQIKAILEPDQAQVQSQQQQPGRNSHYQASHQQMSHSQVPHHQQRSSSFNRDKQEKRSKYKQIAENLKSQMIQSREISKKSEQFLSKLERNGFEYEKNEMIEMDIQLQQGKELCEFIISQLTNEEINSLITNYESLLNKMMGYQEQILTAISLVQPFADEIKKTEKQVYEQIQSKVKKESAQKQGDVPQMKRNNSYKGGNLLLAELENFQPARHQPQKQEEEEEKNDDLWSNLNDFATQYNNELQQQKEEEKKQKQDDFSFPTGKLHEIAQKYDDDPFADAVKENMQQQQQNQGVPADEFFGGFNQQQVNNPQQQDAYDFGFTQQQNQMPPQQQQQQEQQQDEGGGGGKLFEMALGGQIQQQQREASPKRESPPKQGDGVKKLWEADLNDFNTNASQNQQQQQNFYGGGQQSNINNEIDQALELSRLRKEVQELRNQNQRLKDKEVYSQGINESYSELNRQYKSLMQQIESDKQYYRNQIYDRDTAIQQKDNQIEQMQREIQNLNSYIHDLEYKFNTGVAGKSQEALEQQDEPAHQFHTTNQIWLRDQSPKKEEKKEEDENPNEQRQNEQQYSQPDLNQQEFQSNLQLDSVHQAENSQEDVSPQQKKSQKSPKSGKNIYLLNLYLDQKEEAMRKTLDNFYFRALFSDKSKIYEDVHVQLGCIRNVSEEWKTALFKLYLGNKSDKAQLTNISITSFQPSVKIQNGPIPSVLQPKGQREIIIAVTGFLDDVPSIMFSYQLGEKNSGNINIRLPCNPFFYCTPFNVTGQNFNRLWEFYRNKKSQTFNMDLTKAANIQQLKQVISLNEKHASFISGVDEKPNIVAFAAQHSEGQVLVKIELSGNGKDCKAEITLENTTEICQKFLETVVDLIGQK